MPNYETHCKLAERDLSRSKKYLATTYAFLLISAAFFCMFFLSDPQLPFAGCAFLCDAAAVVYLRKAILLGSPFRQTDLARKCAAAPDSAALMSFAAALEAVRRQVRYSDRSMRLFREAFLACQASPSVNREELALLARVLREKADLSFELEK